MKTGYREQGTAYRNSVQVTAGSYAVFPSCFQLPPIGLIMDMEV
jgi:hypothetical protein